MPIACCPMAWRPSSRLTSSVYSCRACMHLSVTIIRGMAVWQAGGRLHVLLGNHETMNAAGRFNYATLPGLVEFYNAQTLQAWGAGLKVPPPLACSMQHACRGPAYQHAPAFGIVWRLFACSAPRWCCSCVRQQKCDEHEIAANAAVPCSPSAGAALGRS